MKESVESHHHQFVFGTITSLKQAANSVPWNTVEGTCADLFCVVDGFHHMVPPEINDTGKTPVTELI